MTILFIYISCYHFFFDGIMGADSDVSLVSCSISTALWVIPTCAAPVIHGNQRNVWFGVSKCIWGIWALFAAFFFCCRYSICFRLFLFRRWGRLCGPESEIPTSLILDDVARDFPVCGDEDCGTRRVADDLHRVYVVEDYLGVLETGSFLAAEFTETCQGHERRAAEIRGRSKGWPNSTGWMTTPSWYSFYYWTL